MAIDALAGGLAFGAADAADVAAPLAVDVGADVAAGAATDVAATTGADIAASTVPDLTAEEGLATASQTFGDFSPEVFAANEADVAAGGLGTDFATAGLGTDLTAGADFTGTSGDLLSGAGGGPGAGVVGGPVGDTFGGVGASPDVLSDVGTAGGGTNVAAPASWGDVPTPEGFTSPGTQAFGEATSNQPLYSDSGIVDTGGNQFEDDFNQFTTTDQGVSMPTDMASRVGAVPVTTQSTTLEQAFPGASQAITGETPDVPASFSNNLGGEPSSVFDPTTYAPSEPPPSQLATMQQVGMGPSYAPVQTAEEAFAPPAAAEPLPPATEVAGGIPPTAATTTPTAVTAAPGTTPGGFAPTDAELAGATTGTAPTATAAAGGVSPLTALRYGTAGVNAIAAGVNLSNALNQPSYPALQPAAYPGSIYSPYYSSMQPGVGGGGIAGGTAAARLTNGLVSGQSPQQLAQSGIISPQRAATLQQTYNDIAQQYAQTLGVSPQSLSTGVQQMIAARALGDMGLGGR